MSFPCIAMVAIIVVLLPGAMCADVLAYNECELASITCPASESNVCPSSILARKFCIPELQFHVLSLRFTMVVLATFGVLVYVLVIIGVYVDDVRQMRRPRNYSVYPTRCLVYMPVVPVVVALIYFLYLLEIYTVPQTMLNLLPGLELPNRFYKNDIALSLAQIAVAYFSLKFARNPSTLSTVEDRDAPVPRAPRVAQNNVSPDHSGGDQEICPICLSDLLRNAGAVLRLKCSHEFHTRCIFGYAFASVSFILHFANMAQWQSQTLLLT